MRPLDVCGAIVYVEAVDLCFTNDESKEVGQGLLILARLIARIHAALSVVPANEIPDDSMEGSQEDRDDSES